MGKKRVNSITMNMLEQLYEAIARGWCHFENKDKIIDTDLLMAIYHEVVSLYVTVEQPGKIEGKMDFDLSSHFNNDRTFNTKGPGLAALAGEDHKDSQSYKDVKELIMTVETFTNMILALRQIYKRAMSVKNVAVALDTQKFIYNLGYAYPGYLPIKDEQEYLRPLATNEEMIRTLCAYVLRCISIQKKSVSDKFPDDLVKDIAEIILQYLEEQKYLRIDIRGNYIRD